MKRWLDGLAIHAEPLGLPIEHFDHPGRKIDVDAFLFLLNGRATRCERIPFWLL
jgi:hypothetical protein